MKTSDIFLSAALLLVALIPLQRAAAAGDDSVVARTHAVIADPTLHVGLRADRILPTNHFVRGYNMLGRKLTSSFTPVVEFTVRNAPDTRYGRWYPSARQGLGAGLQFSSPTGVLGTPALLYAVQSATIATLSPRLSLDYEWNFGAAMGWKTLDHDDPDYDRNIDGVGTPVTAYINFGLYLRYRLSPSMQLFAGAEVTHYSNGNTGDPNPGINMLGARIGASYILGTPLPSVRRADWSDFEPGMAYDIMAYGAWRKWGYRPYVENPTDDAADNTHLVPGKFAVAGFSISPSYRFNPLLSAGLSIDGQYDEGANLSGHYVTATPVDDPKFYRTKFADRISLGVAAHVELRMSLFAINVGLGHSILAPGGKDLRGWYNTFALKTFITDRLFLLTGYKLYRFDVPGNLMLGAGFRI